jgi:hypothetical protein
MPRNGGGDTQLPIISIYVAQPASAFKHLSLVVAVGPPKRKMLWPYAAKQAAQTDSTLLLAPGRSVGQEAAKLAASG